LGARIESKHPPFAQQEKEDPAAHAGGFARRVVPRVCLSFSMSALVYGTREHLADADQVDARRLDYPELAASASAVFKTLARQPAVGASAPSPRGGCLCRCGVFSLCSGMLLRNKHIARFRSRIGSA